MVTSLLAVDTATEICGIALAVNGHVKTELILDRGLTHTQSVLSAIDAVLDIAGVAAGDLDAYAVTRGPGSFTGLRIGISTVKGLAMATGKPLVGISSLEVLAHQSAGCADLICPVMDARRREVYWTLYQRNPDGLAAIMEERVGPIAEITPAIGRECEFIGNGVPKYRSELQKSLRYPSRWTDHEGNALRPAVLARLAWQRFHDGETSDTRTFAPVYLRKSDAELHREASGAAAGPPA